MGVGVGWERDVSGMAGVTTTDRPRATTTRPRLTGAGEQNKRCYGGSACDFHTSETACHARQQRQQSRESMILLIACALLHYTAIRYPRCALRYPLSTIP